ncbi:MAG: nucleoside deaminase [Candidatus Margulisiibacteriota bacterium]
MKPFINQAINLAKKAAEQNEFPVGALVVKDGSILGEGYNQKESLNDPTAHAEILAIQAAAKLTGDWRLVGATLVTTLEPCPMCLGASLQARIKTIIYLAKDHRWGACGSIMDFSKHSELNHHCDLVYLPNQDVVDMMTGFFKSIGKRS